MAIDDDFVDAAKAKTGVVAGRPAGRQIVAGKGITIVGAGITGLWQAHRLALDGHSVRLIDRSREPFSQSASRLAGAMLSPECEAEAAPPIVRELGRAALARWREAYPDLIQRGALVVAQTRDKSELARFARLTERHEMVAGTQFVALEPRLAERFDEALYYPSEAHMAAPDALSYLLTEVRLRGVDVQFGETEVDRSTDVVIDCRGWAAHGDVPGLRGVRGERLIVRCREVALARPVRLLHPRQPIYVVPWGDDLYMIGATVIERDDDGPATVKSALELMGALYALDPGFAEAEIVDMAAGVRPAFADNVPRVIVSDGGRRIAVNGAYRHGFLLAPALAEAVAGYVSGGVSEHPLLRVAG